MKRANNSAWKVWKTLNFDQHEAANQRETNMELSLFAFMFLANKYLISLLPLFPSRQQVKEKEEAFRPFPFQTCKWTNEAAKHVTSSFDHWTSVLFQRRIESDRKRKTGKLFEWEISTRLWNNLKNWKDKKVLRMQFNDVTKPMIKYLLFFFNLLFLVRFFKDLKI